VNASSVGLVPDAAKVSGSRWAQPFRPGCAIGATIPDLVVSQVSRIGPGSPLRRWALKKPGAMLPLPCRRPAAPARTG
jgi:hypothetical protein